MPVNQVRIANIEYEISPLRVKHLRQISEMIKEPAPTEVYASLSRFFPFIAASIKEKNPGFIDSMLEEGTLEEITTAWRSVIDLSGITIGTKSGEKQPTTDLAGAASTEGSQPASAGATA